MRSTRRWWFWRATAALARCGYQKQPDGLLAAHREQAAEIERLRVEKSRLALGALAIDGQAEELEAQLAACRAALGKAVKALRPLASGECLMRSQTGFGCSNFDNTLCAKCAGRIAVEEAAALLPPAAGEGKAKEE